MYFFKRMEDDDITRADSPIILTSGSTSNQYSPLISKKGTSPPYQTMEHSHSTGSIPESAGLLAPGNGALEVCVSNICTKIIA